MSRRRRQLAVRNPDVLLLLPLLARAHCHARIVETKAVDRSIYFVQVSRLSPQADSVGTSMIAARPSCQATTPINASDPTTTSSSMAAATRDLRILGITTPLTATNRKAGAKMPTVAATAPGIPPMMYPIN